MKTAELLARKSNDIVCTAPDQSLRACIDLMNEKRIGALMVMNDDGSVAGLLTERDILRNRCGAEDTDCPMKAKDIMTPADKLISVTAESRIDDMMNRMTQHKVRHLPVMEGDKLKGIISIGDVVKALLDAALEENKNMKEYMFGRQQVL